MKYTRFGRERARLEERARLREERARLREEFAPLKEESALPGPIIGLTGARFGGAAGRRRKAGDARLEEKFARLEEEREWLEHARSARFLLAIAVRLLPPSKRARYLEEFRAELLDVPRDTRLSHALSLLRGVFVLRLRRGPKNKATDAAVRRAKD